jgi:hypothetical protein
MEDDLPCRHRSLAIGTVQCGCGGERKVYRCDHPAAGPLVTRHAAQPRRKHVRLFERTPEGKRRLDLESFRLPACVHCPHRPGASPELVAMFGPPAPEPCLDQARASICGACPRIDARGQAFECAGPQVPGCPLALWPEVLPDRSRGPGGGCCG